MSTAKKTPKHPAPPSRQHDEEDDGVLFEGELTWTHEGDAVRAAKSSRRRYEDPSASQPKKAMPREGSIQIQALTETSGEIFNSDPSRPVAATTPAETETVPETQPVPPPSGDQPLAADEQVLPPIDTEAELAAEAAAPAPTPPLPAATPKPARGRLLKPIDDVRAQPAGTNPAIAPVADKAEPASPVASEFAQPAEDTTRAVSRRKLLLGGAIAFVVLLIIGGAAYFFASLPKRPANVLARALATTLQQQSVQFALSSVQQGGQGQTLMQLKASGGISQAGSYTLNASLQNLATVVPLQLNARSINGTEDYVQFSNLNANQSFLVQLGLPAATVGQTAQQLDGHWLVVPAAERPSIYQALGFGSSASVNLNSSQKQAVASLYKQDPFLSVNKVLPEAVVAGQPSYHYQLAVDKTELTAFLIAAKDRIKALGITQTQIDAANHYNTSGLTSEIWIAKKGGLIDQVQTNRVNDLGHLTVRLSLSHFDDTLALQQPDAPTDLNTALKQAAGPKADDAAAQALLQTMLSRYAVKPAPATRP